MVFWYLRALRKFAVFSGRARRREYWYFTLVSFIISFALGLIGGFLDGIAGANGALARLFGAMTCVYALATMLPSLGVGIRRLHDIGKSGWWLLLSLVPIVGTIVIVVLLTTDSEEGPNRFGPSAKSDASATRETAGLAAV